LLLAGGSTGVYLINYMTTYATETLHMPKWAGFGATVVIGAVGAVAGGIGGALSDRFGRKPLQIAPTAFMVVALVPMFAFLAAVRSPAALLTVSAVLGVGTGLAGAAVLAAITESLPKSIRGGTFGVVYALAISVFGGMTQFMIAWLTAVTHNPLAPPVYVAVILTAQLCGMILMPETAPRRARTTA
jgi:MHS family citrate/tricarballylate:H+ symporter-like MFS transporter